MYIHMRRTLRIATISSLDVSFSFSFGSFLSTQGRRRLQGFLPQLDEFYFTTPGKENFKKLQMHCSEFHERLIHLNTKHGALYCP